MTKDEVLEELEKLRLTGEISPEEVAATAPRGRRGRPCSNKPPREKKARGGQPRPEIRDTVGTAWLLYKDEVKPAAFKKLLLDVLAEQGMARDESTVNKHIGNLAGLLRSGEAMAVIDRVNGSVTIISRSDYHRLLGKIRVKHHLRLHRLCWPYDPQWFRLNRN